MLQRLAITLTWSSGNLRNGIKQIIFFELSKRNYWESMQQYNEFNEVIKQNRYYIYEFWEE